VWSSALLDVEEHSLLRLSKVEGAYIPFDVDTRTKFTFCITMGQVSLSAIRHLLPL